MKNTNAKAEKLVSQKYGFILYRISMYLFFLFPSFASGQIFIADNTHFFVAESTVITDSSSIRLQAENEPEKIYIVEGTLVTALPTNFQVSFIKNSGKKNNISHLTKRNVKNQLSHSKKERLKVKKHDPLCSYSSESSKRFSPYSSGDVSGVTSNAKSSNKPFTILTEQAPLSFYDGLKIHVLNQIDASVLLSVDCIRPPPPTTSSYTLQGHKLQ